MGKESEDSNGTSKRGHKHNAARSPAIAIDDAAWNELQTLRASGVCNMLDLDCVKQEAFILGLDALLAWIASAGAAQYGLLITFGKRK